MKVTTDNAFRAKLRANIHEWIKDAIKHGTTGVGMDCLMQCVKTPHAELDGAPKGGNLRWQYCQVFREVCEGDKVIQAFLI